MTGYLASVSKDEGHHGGTWTMRAQAGHRESRSGNSTSLEGEGWHRGRRCCHEAPAGLCSTRAECHGRHCRRLGAGGTAFGSPTCLDVRPGPGCLPRTVPRAGASTPAGPRFPGTMATSGLSGRTRLPKWASRWPPSGPDPSPRP